MMTSIQVNKYSFIGSANEQNNMNQVSISRIKKDDVTKPASEEEKGTIKSVQGDLLTISDVAKKRLEETNKSEQIELLKENAEKNNGITDNAAVHEEIAFSHSGLSDYLEEVDDDENNKLSGFSKYELTELLKEGYITQYEYNTEIKEREEEQK